MTAATVGSVLAEAQRRIERVDAQALLAHVLQRDTAFLIAHANDPVEETARATYMTLVTRRISGEPVAYLTGRREFFSRDFRVTPDVLIPRPETELLVELALERLPHDRPARVLDLGAGSGCVGITIALERPRAHVTCVDRSSAALDVARDNAARLRCPNVELLEGSWYDAVTGRRFDVLVSNPPYVAERDAHLGALRFEPREALVSGTDGYAAIRAIAEGAPTHAAPDAWLLFEHGHEQAAEARKLLEQLAYTQVFSARDLAGIERVTGGMLRG